MMSKNAVEFPSPHDRKRLLDQTRNLKMARSPHRYVRGSMAKFYQWVDDLKGGAIPEGPAIWTHGDCHSGNRADRHSDPRSRPDGDWQSRA
jgi:uncharacterized protein (DUF2252 family)